jgi:hypothetical protein
MNADKSRQPTSLMQYGLASYRWNEKVRAWRSGGDDKIPIYDDIHSFPGPAKRGMDSVHELAVGQGYMVGLMLCIFGFLRAESGQNRPIWSPPTPCWKDLRLLSFSYNVSRPVGPRLQEYVILVESKEELRKGSPRS